MTYDTDVSREQLGQIYKTASSRMTKKALDWDSLKDSFKNLNISDDAKMALLGGLGGAGIGFASHLITPKDKDEDLRGRMLSHILTGAALGGIAGYGGSRLYKRVAPMVTPEKPGWYQRNAPEVTYSGTAALAGLGAGAYAGAKGLDNLRGGTGARLLASTEPGSDALGAIRQFLSASEKDRSGKGLKEIRNAYNIANGSIKDRLLSKLNFQTGHIGDKIPRWLGGDVIRVAAARQATKDKALLDALVNFGSGNTRHTGEYKKLLDALRDATPGSRLANVRKIMNSMRRGGGWRRALGAAGASAALLMAGAALRGVNQ